MSRSKSEELELEQVLGGARAAVGGSERSSMRSRTRRTRGARRGAGVRRAKGGICMELLAGPRARQSCRDNGMFQ